MGKKKSAVAKQGAGNASPKTNNKAKATQQQSSSVKEQHLSSGLAAMAKELDQKPAEMALRTLNDSEQAKESLRGSLGALFKLNADATSTSKVATHKGTSFAAGSIQTESRYTPEQLWGQLNVLYGPVLRGLDASIAAQNEKATHSEGSKTSKKKINVFEDLPDEEVDEEMDFEAAMAADNGADDDENDDALFEPRKKKEKVDKKDAWRYAFGMDGDADEDEEMEEPEGAPRRGYKHNPDAMGSDDDDEGDFAANGLDDEEGELDEEDDGEYHERDFGEDDDLDDFADGEDDNAAAMAEMYGEGNFDEDDILGDFADPDDDGDEPPEEEGEEPSNGRKVKFGRRDEVDAAEGEGYGDEDFYGEGEEREEGEGDEAPEDEEEEGLTRFQLEERKRLRETQDLEETRLFDKHWTMTGEAAAAARPKDSLIDTQLDFEHAMRPVPIITEAVTEKLEERIKRRILDGNFDDVKRKQLKTTAADLNTIKKDEALDAQKSKLSLMDLYEKEYLEKQKAAAGGDGATNAEPLTEIEKDELRALNMWKRLSQHLDALTNFYFTPKPVMEDTSARVRAVENQAPAIALESVGIGAVQSTQSALAPQDLFRQRKGKFVGVSKNEMDPKEKQALRRAHKTSSRMKSDIVNAKKDAGKREREATKKAAAEAEA